MSQISPAQTRPDLLRLEGVGKTFGSFVALDAIELCLAPGEIHCLLGENGAGKSTLCNLIFGVHQPSHGKMFWQGQPYAPAGPRGSLEQGIAMVHQHFSLSPSLSTLGNLLLGQSDKVLNRRQAADEIRALAHDYGLDLDLDQKVGDLPIGVRQRVEIMKALIRRPKLLILDEPTAVLLPQEIDALLQTIGKISAAGCAVLLVTHKLAEIRKVAQRASVLRAGKVVARSDQPDTDMNRLVAAMIGSDAMPEWGRRSAVAPGPEVMRTKGLCYRDPSGGAVRLDDVSLSVRQGEIVGIAGVEGNGQSELGDIFSGIIRPSAGQWWIEKNDLTQASARQATRAGVGIIPEDRHLVAIAKSMSLTENILNNRLHDYSRFGLLDRKRMRADALDLIARFDVRAPSPDIAIGGLSGGNQQKAVLARELTTPGLRFLLAAQPTRGLDVGAVEAVYRMIRQACDTGVGVLLISSELDEILAVSDRILVMYRGRIVAQRNAKDASRAEIGALMAGKDL